MGIIILCCKGASCDTVPVEARRSKEHEMSELQEVSQNLGRRFEVLTSAPEVRLSLSIWGPQKEAKG